MDKSVTDLKAEFECKTEDDSVGTFSGVASTSEVDSDNDIIAAGAFDPIPMRTAPGGQQVPNVMMLRDHDRTQVIGGWRSFKQQGSKLLVEGELALAVEKARETHELMKRGFLSGLSVCFSLSDPAHMVYDHKSGRRTIKKALLRECSIVGFPANQNARITNVKSEVDQWLIDRGFASGDLEKLLRQLKQGDGEEPPEPKESEDRAAYMSRCMKATGGDVAACSAAWSDSEKTGKQNDDDGLRSRIGRFNIAPVTGEDEETFMERCRRKTGGDEEACSAVWEDWEEEQDEEEKQFNRKFRSHLRRAKEDDPRKPWGDVEYADPGYQDDKVKRYPVHTERHIRAAWSYIHMPRNRRPYSAAELERIEARIVAAWKKKIDPDGPPAYQENKTSQIMDLDSVATGAQLLMTKLSKRVHR